MRDGLAYIAAICDSEATVQEAVKNLDEKNYVTVATGDCNNIYFMAIIKIVDCSVSEIVSNVEFCGLEILQTGFAYVDFVGTLQCKGLYDWRYRASAELFKQGAKDLLGFDD